MKKSDFIKMIEHLPDDAEIIVLKDGGEYWGDYYEDTRLRISSGPETVGHPGGSSGRNVGENGVVIIS